MKRFLVTVLRTSRFDAALVPAHGAFLDNLRQRQQLELAGPFANTSGGAYLLLADDLQAAETLAFTDPLHTSGSSDVSVREWNAR